MKMFVSQYNESKGEDKDQESIQLNATPGPGHYKEKRQKHKKGKKGGKDQESIQSRTTPDPGYHMGK